MLFRSNFFMLYGGLLLGMSPISLLAYDQGSRFSVCSVALPVTKEQLVGGKYLIGLCGMALAELLSMAALAAAQLLWGTVSVQITVATLIQVAMLTLLELNHCPLAPSDDDLIRIGLDVASGTMSAEQVRDWIISSIR